MPFDFRPAVRINSKLLVGLYGQSGCGKTYSSLLLARGLAGSDGKIVMIDTESGRGELYADVIPGGYEVAQLAAPFSPVRYIEAIEAAEKTGAAVLILDSGSHEWEGIGGVIDMAGAIEQRTGKPGLHCWKEPKLQHQRFILKLLQTPLHVIVCLRAKYKSRQAKNPRTGKTEIVKDEHTTPIQAEDFIFESTAHAEILSDHTIRLTKCSHPQTKDCWPADAPLSVAAGAALATWCRGGVDASKRDVAAEAEAAANRGTDAFQLFWKGLGAAGRDLMRPSLPDLQTRCERADASSDDDDQPADPAEAFVTRALAAYAGAPTGIAISVFQMESRGHYEALSDEQQATLRQAEAARRVELKGAKA